MKLKRILPISFVLLLVIGVITIILVIKNEEKTIKIKSFDDKSTFVIAKAKVENYQSSVNHKEKKISFKVKNGDDFYNEYIKNKDFFNEILVEESNSKKAYLFYDNYYYLYYQKDNEIFISTVYSHVGITKGVFFVITPFYYCHGEAEGTLLFDLKNTDMAMIKEFYSKFTNNYCKIEENIIYVKAMKLEGKEWIPTENYFLKIYEENNEIKCSILLENL